MNWTRFAIVVLGSGFVTSMTDWFFAGDWIHRRFTYPEIWRTGPETRAIILSSALPFLTCGVFEYMLIRLGATSVSAAIALAAAVWLIGPLPLLLTNAAFIKLHRVFVASYAAGWLVKLLIAAWGVSLFLQ